MGDDMGIKLELDAFAIGSTNVCLCLKVIFLGVNPDLELGKRLCEIPPCTRGRLAQDELSFIMMNLLDYGITSVSILF